ncbi:hypothetical protein AMAG_03007 [Allomyces macrogynus ATCC 38327]|uniref:Uncharacterized protein n=1 Tax=Allomyces macrogynus (strain ATCC 38327) TaxID=578462 RepID=A0A0L0S4A2_ALLM3|nr:hypothetical protein AMAG_03007 [Allomyces macrogynus ATCC 38327]|eukprot:KNE57275.1 hypothetical protein AMAG_03007 [Allomyces macrogynus ATCC 38327]
MLMLVRKANAGADDGAEYEITVQNCQVPATADTTTGFIDVAAGCMTEFTVDGEPTTNLHRMLPVLPTYYCSALHPKLHVMAEVTMRKIEEYDIRELYPSLEITRPARHFDSQRASLLTESRNWKDFTHTAIFLFKDTIPFVKFLWAAGNAYIKQSRRFGLDMMHAEYLFIHSVGHSDYHYCSTKFTEHLQFPIFIDDENTTNWADLVGSACARAVNQEWAEVVTASIMY